MKFNFKDSLNKGRDAAEQVLVHRQEIKAVFSSLEESLKEFLEQDVELSNRIEYENTEDDDIFSARNLSVLSAYSGIAKPRKTTGYKQVILKKDNVESSDLFCYQQDSKGYPVKIKYDKQNFICMTQDELADTLGIVLEDSNTHIKIKAFVNKISSET